MTTPSIPADEVVNVTPGVVSAGGTGLDLSGLILTNGTRAPIGTVPSFANAKDVETYFGGGSAEATLATNYFLGFDNSDVKPAVLFFAQFNIAAVSGYVRGGPGITLAAVQAITSGTLAVTVNGTLKTSSALNLSSAGSLSAAAAAIQAAFTTPGFTVTYDSVSGAFVITSSTTGSASTIVVTSGAVATALKLTTATGLVTSPGAVATTAALAGAAMDAITAQTQDFVAFMTVFEAADDVALALATWNNAQANRYAYVYWSTNILNASPGNTTILQYILDATGLSGTITMYAPLNGASVAAFVLGFGGSLDTSATNGRADLCNRHQAGLVADVSDSVTYNALLTNHVNCYGTFGTANDRFTWFRKGTISGDFAFYDTYINQIWLNNNLQLAGMTLMDLVKNIPYTAAGDAMISQGLQDPIDEGLTFGAIRVGVELSSEQVVAVNNSAGVRISDVLQTRGWYLQIVKATAEQRGARAPRRVKFWYTDGQSVQGLDITSLEVQ